MSLVDKARDLFNKSQPVFSPHKWYNSEIQYIKCFKRV